MYASIVLGSLALAGSAFAAPAPVALPASSATQQQIINLENTIVHVINDFVQSNVAGAKADYASALSQFNSISKVVLTPTSYQCPPITAMGRPSTMKQAIITANDTQNALMQLSLDLQNSKSSAKLINGEFCTAYNTWLLDQYYANNLVGKPQPKVQTLEAVNYNATALDSTWLATEVALEALIAALNAPPATSQPTASTKTAYKNAMIAIANFKIAAQPHPGKCPATPLPAPATPKATINDVYFVEKEAQRAYADTRADNKKKFGDFCTIYEYMSAINAFVKA